MDGFEEDDFLVLSVIFGPQEGPDVVGVGRLWDIGATDSFSGPRSQAVCGKALGMVDSLLPLPHHIFF